MMIKIAPQLFLSAIFLSGCGPSTIVKNIPSSTFKTLGEQHAKCQGDINTWSNCYGEQDKGEYTYKGEYLEGKPHGAGEELWDRGHHYKGTFENGDRNGEFVVRYPSGNVFEGRYAFDKRNGPGKLTYSDGTTFSGSYKNGKRHGLGVVNYSDGGSFSAEYLEGEIVGEGIENRPNGTRQWTYSFDGKEAPFKVIQRASGLLGFVATDDNGNFDGPGIWYGTDNTVSFVQYESGVMAGKFLDFDSDGHISQSSLMSQGEIIEGTSALAIGNPYNEKSFDHPCSKQKYSREDVCTGRWKYRSGGYYEGGRDRSNQKTGYGVSVLGSGDIYRGQFSNDVRHGFFSYTYANGQQVWGFLQEGKDEGLQLWKRSDTQITVQFYRDGEGNGISVDFDFDKRKVKWGVIANGEVSEPNAKTYARAIPHWLQEKPNVANFSLDERFKKIAMQFSVTAAYDGITWPTESEIVESGELLTESTVAFWRNDSGTIEGRVVISDGPEIERQNWYNAIIDQCRKEGGEALVAIPTSDVLEKFSQTIQPILCTDYGKKDRHLTLATQSLKADDSGQGILILESYEHYGDAESAKAEFREVIGEI